MVHLQFHARQGERFSYFLKDLVFFRPSGQRSRIAPPMLVDGFDGIGAFEKNKFALEPYKELDERFLFGCSLVMIDG